MTFLTQKLICLDCRFLCQTIDSTPLQQKIIIDREIIIDESIEL